MGEVHGCIPASSVALRIVAVGIRVPGGCALQHERRCQPGYWPAGPTTRMTPGVARVTPARAASPPARARCLARQPRPNGGRRCSARYGRRCSSSPSARTCRRCLLPHGFRRAVSRGQYPSASRCHLSRRSGGRAARGAALLLSLASNHRSQRRRTTHGNYI